MTDTASDRPPARLSNDPSSPLYDETVLSRGVGIRFKGAERNDVEEYDAEAGWIRVALARKVDRRGRPLTIKLVGEVEPYFLTPAEGVEDSPAEDAQQD
ncbi:hypothetical protein GGR88_001779 [Sphingomonas jejuensis]|uniref:Glutathione peroxidase n=1 Tax=Sphingomonas jejuensis TaxID=904715 RepID=A0ABX0XM44_9SPHN|nr:DUF3297 family protein [Sphingomonas jejuensis]NJC34305.1 hypothetical protein [Sphingomonas jejuensis]